MVLEGAAIFPFDKILLLPRFNSVIQDAVDLVIATNGALQHLILLVLFFLSRHVEENVLIPVARMDARSGLGARRHHFRHVARAAELR